MKIFYGNNVHIFVHTYGYKNMDIITSVWWSPVSYTKLMLVHSLRDGPLYDQERQIIILVVFINRIVY